MEVYRIAAAQHINNLLGDGARRYGGRWNRKGTGIIYTSESRALAAVEYLVHVPLSIVPANLTIAILRIPDRVTAREIVSSDLPDNWRDYPAPPELAALGSRWVASEETLLLRVPSVVVDQELNILINPSHPDMKKVAITAVEPFRFDDRLLR